MSREKLAPNLTRVGDGKPRNRFADFPTTQRQTRPIRPGSREQCESRRAGCQSPGSGEAVRQPSRRGPSPAIAALLKSTCSAFQHPVTQGRIRAECPGASNPRVGDTGDGALMNFQIRMARQPAKNRLHGSTSHRHCALQRPGPSLTRSPLHPDKAPGNREISLDSPRARNRGSRGTDCSERKMTPEGSIASVCPINYVRSTCSPIPERQVPYASSDDSEYLGGGRYRSAESERTHREPRERSPLRLDLSSASNSPFPYRLPPHNGAYITMNRHQRGRKQEKTSQENP